MNKIVERDNELKERMDKYRSFKRMLFMLTVWKVIHPDQSKTVRAMSDKLGITLRY